jgi:hypothetical protein
MFLRIREDSVDVGPLYCAAWTGTPFTLFGDYRYDKLAIGAQHLAPSGTSAPTAAAVSFRVPDGSLVLIR